MSVPQSARAVVIGGGIIGCSIAYHLAKLGMKDVVLLERDKLTSGTTWHAAGLMVCFGSTSETSTEFRKYSKQLYKSLEAETGLSTGFKPVGFIEIASDKGRLEEYRRVSAFNRQCGVEVHEISPQEVEKLFPLCRVDDVHAGFYVPDDGRVNPVDVTMALAKGAKLRGVNIIEGCPVTGVTTKWVDNRYRTVTGVTTAHGNIATDLIVNCCGMWTRQLAAQSGISVPLQAAEHYYLLTEKFPEISTQWPVIEDPGCYGYYREEGGGMMVGLFEPVCAPWNVKGIPKDSSFTTIAPDWERLTPFLEKAMSRVPHVKSVGVKQLFCGPESFTPDLAPILGEAPEVRNYFVAAGLNSIGILTGGGVGRAMAHWMIHGKPDVDVTGVNIDRLQKYQSNPEYLAQRTVESLGLVYACHYPASQKYTARNSRKGPLHDRLVANNAYFKEVSGWEGADWYAPAGKKPIPDPHSWSRVNWFEYWAAEHLGLRSGVALMDMSFMSKYIVQGPDAGAALDYISANSVNGPDDTITYTQWLNDDGKVEADITVTKIDNNTFFVVATDTMHRHVEAHFRRHARGNCSITDVTSGTAQINIQGPRSRELMQKLTTVDMSNEAFPFRCSKEIPIGFARVRCTRITYVGELGYELYVSSEQATHVYDMIVEAGKSVGLIHAGLKALGSLRMEKGYRDFGHDLDNTDSVLDAGLGFAVNLKKPDFLGKAACVAHKASGNLFKNRIVQVQCLDPEPLMYHAEPILRNGKAVGYVRAASYGHSLGGAVGLGMISGADSAQGIVNQKFIDEGTFEVQIANTKYPAKVSIKPLFDPDMLKIKC